MRAEPKLLIREAVPGVVPTPSRWPRARPTHLPSALGLRLTARGPPPLPGAVWAPSSGAPFGTFSLTGWPHSLSGWDNGAHWRDEKTEAQCGEVTPATWVSREPQAWDQPHTAVGSAAPSVTPPTHPGAPVTQHCALPPSLSLLMHLQVWAAPAQELLPGPQHPCGSSHRHPGVTESSQRLHPEHSANPQTASQNQHLFCSQTCTSARWAVLRSTWGPIS